MALQRQIWSKFDTVAVFKTWPGYWFLRESCELGFPNLLTILAKFLQIYTFKSSSNFYPIGKTWRKMARSVCLKPVSMETWRLHILWRFTVPALYQRIFIMIIIISLYFSAILGVLMPQSQEAAFANFRFWQAIGFLISFGVSVSSVLVGYKLIALLALLIISVILYYIVECVIRREGLW